MALTLLRFLEGIESTGFLVKILQHIWYKMQPLLVMLAIFYMAAVLSLYLLLGQRSNRSEDSDACQELLTTLREIPNDY